MDKEMNNAIAELSMKYLQVNYDKIWLGAMLEKAKTIKGNGNLVIGSSHALNGITESLLPNCVNCSMHSQDIYYDFKCAKSTLENSVYCGYKNCFIVMGYYIVFQDLSKSTIMRNMMITPVYYPIFKDAHNWTEPLAFDTWQYFQGVPEEVKPICEMLTKQLILQKGTYYSDLKTRKPYYDFKDKEWYQLSIEQKEQYGKERAGSHNKMVVHEASFVENCEIMKDLVGLLKLHGITPVVVIPPFTSAYNKYVESRYKEAIVEMLEKIDQEVHFVDFNDSDLFEDRDFVDTDHLNKVGANKLSSMLYQIFI